MFNSKITTIALSALCLWFLVLASGAHIRYGTASQELSVLEDRILSRERDAQRLAQQLERMKEPDWLALIARERLNYKRPDEQVVFVYPSDQTAPIATPVIDDTPNWKKWLDWILSDMRD